MAPTSRVILCRHSQAEHNVDLDYSIPDAPLTALGKKQSAALAPQIPKLQQEVDLIITSALKRTLQSTKLGWGPAVKRLGIQNVICLPQAQECNDFPCDTGSPREQLESIDEFKDYNLELLTPDWTSKRGFYAPDPDSIAKRAQWVRQYIRNRKEGVIVLVAHGDFLRRITSSADGPSTYQWKNAEVREYSFDPKTVDSEECFLIQEEDVAAAAGYDGTSTEIDVVNDEQTDVMPQQKERTSSVDQAEAAVEASTSTIRETAPEKTKSTGLLKAEDVAKDSTVFTSNGRIVFHRSDGDPDYKPPNLVVPKSSEVIVNYFHIFSRSEQKWIQWSKTVAHKLAVDFFGLSPQQDWTLQDFPKDYYFTEQRKGPNRSYRTDPYLFGSAAHRFRSTNEFLPHAFWLLCDPTLDTRNCHCIYCSKGGRGGGGKGLEKVSLTTTPTSSKRVSKPVSRFPASQGPSYRANKTNYKIRAQISPRGQLLPGVPLAIYSSQDRNTELAAVETKEFGDCEGFRVGEIAYCYLKKPIVSEEDAECKITAWPVMIEAAKMVVIVEEQSQGRNGRSTRDSFDLQGKVKQKRMYDVTFLPTHEKTRVEEDRLLPGLMFLLPSNLRTLDTGSKKDHSWIENNTTPVLNLENGEKRPAFRQALFCFLYAVKSFQNLRLFYTVTEKFSRTEMGRQAVKNVVFAEPNGKSKDKEAAAPWLAGRDGHAAASAERRVDNNGANRFLQVTEQNNYMDLDSDERNNRRRGNVKSLASTAAITASNAVVPALDNNTYWQGILLGLERVWVGDLVRLRLSAEDVETMMASLAKGNDLFNAEDRVKPDLTSPYVLRIKAIYRIAKAEVEQTDDKIRVAGDVFRVVALGDGQESGTEKSGVRVKNEDEGNNEIVLQEDRSHRSKNKKKNNTSTFEIPFRPFLEKAYENQLPMTPSLPKGFTFQRVNQSSVEVVCSIQQLAGRLWCSFAKEDDDKVAKLEKKKQYLAHEDSKDLIRIRLSLVGILPGAVKAMEVHSNEGLFINRDRAIAQACQLALQSRLQIWEKQEKDSRELRQAAAAEGTEEANRVSKRPRIEKGGVDSSVTVSGQPHDKPSEEGTVSESIKTILSSVSLGADTLFRSTSNAPARSDSPPLPEHWIKRASRSGQGTYFANVKTKETSWVRPTA